MLLSYDPIRNNGETVKNRNSKSRNTEYRKRTDYRYNRIISS
jgi:hypothetical protein